MSSIFTQARMNNKSFYQLNFNGSFKKAGIADTYNVVLWVRVYR
jgi:hypothetical protein